MRPSAVMPVLAALLITATAAFSPPSAAQQAPERHKVVLQVSDNDPGKWNLALNNAENIQQALGKDKVDVEIVAYGPGLNMLKAESKVAARISGALDNNVGLLACGTTMRKAKLTEADLAGGVKVVPGGVVHIMKREREGWAYIRP